MENQNNDSPAEELAIAVEQGGIQKEANKWLTH